MRQVGQLDCDLVTAVHTEVAQARGYPARDLVDLCVAEGLVGDMAQRLVRMRVAGLSQNDGEVEADRCLP